MVFATVSLLLINDVSLVVDVERVFCALLLVVVVGGGARRRGGGWGCYGGDGATLPSGAVGNTPAGGGEAATLPSSAAGSGDAATLPSGAVADALSGGGEAATLPSSAAGIGDAATLPSGAVADASAGGGEAAMLPSGAAGGGDAATLPSGTVILQISATRRPPAAALVCCAPRPSPPVAPRPSPPVVAVPQMALKRKRFLCGCVGFRQHQLRCDDPLEVTAKAPAVQPSCISAPSMWLCPACDITNEPSAERCCSSCAWHSAHVATCEGSCDARRKRDKY